MTWAPPTLGCPAAQLESHRLTAPQLPPDSNMIRRPHPGPSAGGRDSNCTVRAATSATDADGGSFPTSPVNWALSPGPPPPVNLALTASIAHAAICFGTAAI